MSAPEPPLPPSDPTQPTEPLRARARPAAVRPVAPPPLERERLAEPLPPVEDPRWSNPWAAVVAALVALLIGGGIGYAVGHSNAEGSPGTRAAVTHTVTNTHTVVKPTTVVKTNTVTSNTVTQAPANATNEQRRVEAEAKVRTLEKENEELRRQAEAG